MDGAMNCLAFLVLGVDLGSLLLWSGATAGVYAACRFVYLRTRQPLLHPGAVSILLMTATVQLTGKHYAEYAAATAWINWLLGPAVVAMAVPIYQLRRTVRENAGTLALVLPLSVAFAVGSTCGLLALCGQVRGVVAAGALKSITSPVAWRLAADNGVPVKATLAGVLVAGLFGATVGPMALRWLRVRDPRAVGVALGSCAHGFGVARAVEIGRAEGAFASITMSGTAMLGALVLPYLLRWIVSG